MGLRIFITIIIVLAFTVGILVWVLPADQIVRFIKFRDFFDASVPILAFGALVKYLCTFKGGKHHD